jgi:hypothetical protein
MISQGKDYFLSFVLIYSLIPKTVKSVLTVKFVESANVITLWECSIYFSDSMQRLMNITDIMNK